MSVAGHFASSYAQARARFLAAADAAGLDVASHAHPMVGRDGEPLAMDVARFGPADAPAVLLVSSGCHGVEGYCGSGVQVALLGDAGFHDAARQAGVAVLYIHALNPYGFSWWRRVTQENVDLNRNFMDFHRPLPANPGYDEIAHLVVPADWPPGPAVQAEIDRYVAERGLRALQQAMTSGQYGHPQGLFFGGQGPTWSNVTLRHVLQEHGRRCRRLGWIDLHTGLGDSGVGERIFAGRDDAATLARARAWWGDMVTSIYDGSSSSPLLSGLMWMAAYDECPQAEFTAIALEYGTVPVMQVLQALRADQWLENHPEVNDERARAIKQAMFEAFFTDTAAWKQAIVEQGLLCARQAVAGLASV
jgi:hypothetical protein